MSDYFRNPIQTSLSACAYAYFYLHTCTCAFVKKTVYLYIVYSERNALEYLIIIVNFHVSKSIIEI